MKNFRVTVNGNTYDVTVEEIGTTTSSQSNLVPASAPVISQTPQVVSTGSEGNIKVKAPMPGTVVDIKVP